MSKYQAGDRVVVTSSDETNGHVGTVQETDEKGMIFVTLDDLRPSMHTPFSADELQPETTAQAS